MTLFTLLCPYSLQKLEELNIGACGTVKASRKLLPAGLPLQKGDLPVFNWSENLVACAWQDTKQVHILSNVETNLTIDTAVKCRGGESVTKMGDVDCLDQMLGTYQYPQKCLK